MYRYECIYYSQPGLFASHYSEYGNIAVYKISDLALRAHVRRLTENKSHDNGDGGCGNNESKITCS